MNCEALQSKKKFEKAAEKLDENKMQSSPALEMLTPVKKMKFCTDKLLEQQQHCLNSLNYTESFQSQLMQ